MTGPTILVEWVRQEQPASMKRRRVHYQMAPQPPVIETMEEIPMANPIATHRATIVPAFLLLLSALVLPTVLTAQEKGIEAKPDKKALVPALHKGGLVIYFRHAETDQSQMDAERVDFRDCKTQRNLTEKGREQSRAVGKAFAALRIKIAKVITSPYCRAVEMGRLAFGEVTTDDDLAFAIKKPEAETKRLAGHLRILLAMKPPAGTNTVLIAHTANLKEAAGIWPKTEGAAHIFRPGQDGEFTHVGMVLPDEWTELAKVR